MQAPGTISPQTWTNWAFSKVTPKYDYKYTVREDAIIAGKPAIVERQLNPLEAAAWAVAYPALRPSAVQFGMLGKGKANYKFFIVSAKHNDFPTEDKTLKVAITTYTSNSWSGFLLQAVERFAVKKFFGNKNFNGVEVSIKAEESETASYIVELTNDTKKKVNGLVAFLLTKGNAETKAQGVKELQRLQYEVNKATIGIRESSKSYETYIRGETKMAWENVASKVSELEELIQSSITSVKNSNNALDNALNVVDNVADSVIGNLSRFF